MTCDRHDTAESAPAFPSQRALHQRRHGHPSQTKRPRINRTHMLRRGCRCTAAIRRWRSGTAGRASHERRLTTTGTERDRARAARGPGAGEGANTTKAGFEGDRHTFLGPSREVPVLRGFRSRDGSLAMNFFEGPSASSRKDRT
jgi:hypothetical protein